MPTAPLMEDETTMIDRSAEKIPVSIVDRRRVGRTYDGPAAEPDLKPGYVHELEDKVKRAEEALAKRLGELDEEAKRSRQRLLNDLERRFQEKERKLLLEVLGILDDLDRACELVARDAPAVSEGIALIGSRMDQFLRNHGCAKFSPQGEPFDPNLMEAVSMQEGPEGKVVAVFQPGIVQDDVLLRPAQVAVGSGSVRTSSG
jgi:molecular chaperone GrpE